MSFSLSYVSHTHAGTDEAGRGCLIGSVFAAAVMLPECVDLPDLNDSKKLSETKRNRLTTAIKQQALAWCISSASPEEIAQLNILHASMLAMQRAIKGLHILPEKVWVDGNRIPPNLPCPAEAVIKGDAQIAQIAAAAILAKTARDAEMYALAEQYPQYGFDKHKGYATAAHLSALKQFGVLPQHRKDFAPVKALLAQGKLFHN